MRLTLQRVEVGNIDGAPVAEQHHQNGQADRRFGRRHRQDEKDEHLADRVIEKPLKGDEVEIDRQQHELDRHQQDDDVFPIQKNAGHAETKEDRSKHQIISKRDHLSPAFAYWNDNSLL